MKKSLIIISAIILICSTVICTAAPRKRLRRVVYATSIDCRNCVNKIQNNIAFEKGVEDLDVSLEDKTVTIDFNEARTDTVKLADAIHRLGYEAVVIEYKIIK